MSNIIILSLLSLGLVTSFSFIYSVKQEIKFVEYIEIKGSENLISKTIEVADFHSLEASDQVKVIISQGPPSIEISAEDNLIEYLKVENKDGTLSIYREFANSQNIQQNLPMIVRISNLAYDKLVAKNQSEIIIEGNLNQPAIFLTLRDQSNVSGSIETSELEVVASQQSNASLFGNAKKLKLELEDQSNLRAYNLNVNQAEIQIRNQSEARLNVSDEITGLARGNAKVNIKGDPKIKQITKDENAKVN
ncbi:head GIN domain-containing protein [Portibacter marinus]|uniref:head GIN domain-containing protein n=1 Tax=Portibacter marinus TaxID=2898660 RepID=UPI001F2659D7|nr:head GIN domain-containing protein [Portibacter marinus]